MRATVWIDDWQQECCGDPFAPGDDVEWPLSREVDVDGLAAMIGENDAVAVDLDLDSHGLSTDATPRQGTVVSITTVHARYEIRADLGARVALPETARRRRIDRAERFEPRAPGMEFVGYLVDLDLRDDQR